MPEQAPKRKPRTLSVKQSLVLSPNMRRITLVGEDLSDFPVDQESGYIKLMLPCPGEEPYVRTYTIRKQRSDQNEMDIDFALHEGDAPASNWAATAKPGDEIVITGPGAKKRVQPDAEWFFLVGDMTALPALSVNLETLDSDAKGYAVIEVLDEQDVRELKAPRDLELHWVINPHPGFEVFPLVEKVESLAWLDGRVSAWAACEFSSMQRLRRYFKQVRQVEKENLYISSYWKRGVSEDQHKRIKRKDAEENEV